MRPVIKKTKEGKISLKGKMCDVTTSLSDITCLEEGWVQIGVAKLRLASESFEELQSLLGESSRTFDLYTDGSAVPNPGKGGWAAVLYMDQQEIRTVSGGNPRCGNGKMEVAAVANGLSLIPIGGPATVWIDSKYVLDMIGQGLCPPEGPTGWISGWKKNGWVKKDGESVKNVEEVKRLHKEILIHCKGGSSLTFKWVKSHSGVVGNERADFLANEARGSS